MKTMTAKQLGLLLIRMGDKRKIWMASDEEGNAFGSEDKHLSITFNDDCVILYPMSQTDEFPSRYDVLYSIAESEV